MPDLIIVHRDSDNEEVLLNRDHIIFADRVDPSTTRITMTSDKAILVKETLAILRGKL